MRRAALLSLLALGLSGCLEEAEPGPPPTAAAGPSTALPGAYRTGSFVVEWTAAGSLQVVHRDEPSRVLWATRPGAGFLVAADGDAHVEDRRGSFTVADRTTARTTEQSVDSIIERGGAVVVGGRLSGVGFTLTFRAVADHQLSFDVAVDRPGANRLYLTYSSHRSERFFGFGEQFSHFDLKGHRVPILVQEQGIGRGLEPLTSLLEASVGSGGDATTTYAPVPHYITSESRSLFLENDEYAVFDLREPDRVTIELHAHRMRGRILHGRTPLDLIEEYTAYCGRMKPLPDWIGQGAVIGMQGGSAAVRRKLAALDAAGVPVSAFWLQDWVGKRKVLIGSQLWWNWQVDRTGYPDWETLISELDRRDVRVLAYVNPFLAEGTPQFEEARRRGFLVERSDGSPYLLTVTTFASGLLDVTDPAARGWMKDIIRREMLDRGVRGWMADFGEALPFDAVLDSGVDPAAFHNRYPEEWARLNREAVTEAGLDDEVVFFSRSGFTRSPGASRLFWLGDQLTTWDRHDGLASALTALISSGVSGFSLQHGDIGGYTNIDLPVVRTLRDKELFLRWAELAAFTAVFRTHEGLIPEKNHQFDTDTETIAHFGRMARVFRALAPYRRRLMQDAATRGIPLARAPFLHYPDDPVFHHTSDSFLLGPDLLVAPVLEPGARDRRVHLPAGRWVDVWTGAVHGVPGRGTDVLVAAPIGRPPVFHRQGSIEGRRFVDRLEADGLR